MFNHGVPTSRIKFPISVYQDLTGRRTRYQFQYLIAVYERPR